MSSFTITGPRPPADVLYRQARERALRELQARGNDQHNQATTDKSCHFCSSGLYSVPAEGCQGCGNAGYAPRNGHTLEQRSAVQLDQRSTTRCGVCGIPWGTCLHGYQAQGSC
jgi:hypothetical protein